MCRLSFLWSRRAMFIKPAEDEVRKYEILLEVFKDEFGSRDNIQGEMLRMLLKRLIIKLTRLGKKQYLEEPLSGNEYDAVRRFNLLVENHFKNSTKCRIMRTLLHKSPKTLSNLFSKYNNRTPLQVIRERIALEGKRLLLYTDQSASEIAYELGFEEPAHFSRFLKK
ncbi:MAG: helix-turn-helix domain-containing protein [Saprospiraceae bacterium]